MNPKNAASTISITLARGEGCLPPFVLFPLFGTGILPLFVKDYNPTVANRDKKTTSRLIFWLISSEHP
ncbi:MAG: hypothetical protein A2934_00575 [Candidatus Sungbacteria bacterium RIFCSPLOWO2_01_FULL_47_10]|uniref:Uncharacterized protein n=1 Tax=Candidatus Sungbacteria bacterium RIFCSPLOWO2_01_FULL_47_10 TaxID=1802276 RepID=A0A1G2L7N6_9BACT|nr:MAG: hypothetical protein A2934_00575 [Candidatus Sungbacteria bacterium RIFCSPLOWO2_01_FULL_47_10]